MKEFADSALVLIPEARASTALRTCVPGCFILAVGTLPTISIVY
jgi:hypothetical protein